MSTPEIPAPCPPGTPPRAAAMVIRRVLVGPEGTRTGCAAPVRTTVLVTDPRSVRMMRRLATGRDGRSSSNVIISELGSTSRRSKVI
jgi:hypothetical protein